MNVIQLQRTNNTRGLVYYGRTLPTTKKVQPVIPIHKVQDQPDPKFQYYYNLYMRGENQMNSTKEFKDMRLEKMVIMDIENQDEMRIPRLERLRRKVLKLDKAVEAIQMAGKEMPKHTGPVAAAIRAIDVIRTDMLAEIDRLARKEEHAEVNKNLIIKCPTCGSENYFTKQEYWTADGKPCVHCKNAL